MSLQLVIIEGIDQIGKSTFCKNLQDQIQLKYPDYQVEIFKKTVQLNTAKFEPLAKDWRFFEMSNIGFLAAFEEFLGLLKNDKKIIIFDRLHVTAFCYAVVLRVKSIVDVYGNISNFTSYQWRFEELLNRLVKPQNIHYVQFIVDQIENPDEVVSIENLIKIQEQMELWGMSSYLNQIKIYLNSKYGVTDILDHLSSIELRIQNSIEYDSKNS